MAISGKRDHLGAVLNTGNLADGGLFSRLPVIMLTLRKRLALALQLPICFEVRALSGGLVSSTPE
jgi:hypothetical protein